MESRGSQESTVRSLEKGRTVNERCQIRISCSVLQCREAFARYFHEFRRSSIPSPIGQSPEKRRADVAPTTDDSRWYHPESSRGTVLYLAYGSNLAFETFQGRRGIRPLSQINVLTPELKLTFDLPGIAYSEPCFANTARRDTDAQSFYGKNENPGQDYHKDRWHKGLVGVVYEVTPEDYEHIIATEGGGSSYQDVLVKCYPLLNKPTVPSHPTSKHFVAHTLFAPQADGSNQIQKPNDLLSEKDDRIQRPDPAYAQPSARYLKLLTDGAEEHALPAEYKAYLYQIRPYTMTNNKQRIGSFIFSSIWTPFILLLFSLQKMFQGDDGKTPPWLAWLFRNTFIGAWRSYDEIFLPIFGDGERSIPDGGTESRG